MVIMEILVVLFILIFGVSSIFLSWEKQNEKYHRRHREWMKENKKGGN